MIPSVKELWSREKNEVLAEWTPSSVIPFFVDSLEDLSLGGTGEPGSNIGYVYKALGCAAWAIKQPSFREAITKIVQQGGDSDTNAAIAGSLLGCHLGYTGIPPEWIAGLKHREWLEKKVELLCHKILNLV